MRQNVRKLAVLAMVFALLLVLAGCDSKDYKEANELYEAGSYEEAEAIFLELGDYEDSAQMALACRYAIAEELMENEAYEAAAEVFEELDNYEDSQELAWECWYQTAVLAMGEGDYEKAEELFAELGDYKDAQDYADNMASYVLAACLQKNGEVVYTNPDPKYNVTLKVKDEDTFALNYRFEEGDSGYLVYQDVTVEFDIGSTQAKVVAEGNMTIWTAYMKDQGEGKLDLAAFKTGDAVTWDSYTIEGKKIDGKPLDKGTTGVLMMNSNNASLERIVGGVNILLAEMAEAGDVPVMTIADLGFVNCG